MRIAFVARDVDQGAGPSHVVATLVQRFCDEHDVSVFSHSLEGIEPSKVRHYRIPAVSWGWSLNFLVFLICSTIAFGFLRLVGRKKFDIVHAATGLPFFFANVTTSHFCEREGLRLERAGIIKARPVTVLGKLRALDYGLYRRVFAFLEGLTFGRRRPRVRIVVSQRMKEDFIRHYGEAAQDVIVVPNGVDCQRFSPANRALCRDKVRQRHDIPPEAPVLLFAGGDWERKGVRCIIEALSLLPQRDVRLLVVGDGDVEAHQRLARHRQVEERVTFAPRTGDIHQYYAACDIFTFPTLYEPFALVIVEAMASGLPVITSRLAGAADYITDGVSGLLLDTPGNPAELASRIALLLSDRELRETMGRRARKVVEKLSWDEVARRTLDAYNGAMKP